MFQFLISINTLIEKFLSQVGVKEMKKVTDRTLCDVEKVGTTVRIKIFSKRY